MSTIRKRLSEVEDRRAFQEFNAARQPFKDVGMKSWGSWPYRLFSKPKVENFPKHETSRLRQPGSPEHTDFARYVFFPSRFVKKPTIYRWPNCLNPAKLSHSAQASRICPFRTR